eukprot:Skav217870  [mRNA]  locus=scaffold2487:85653:87281:+ [translate_table: standard]
MTFLGGDEVYESLMMGLQLCEQGEQLLEERNFMEAKEVLQEAWRLVEPCTWTADQCGYGRRCDRYCARIEAALARCKMESADSEDPKKTKEALQQMRHALPNDGLNPHAHLDFARALITSLGLEFCQNQANWLDERYIEAHYHASVACALKRADQRQDTSSALPASFKKVFGDLGDDGGWKRVIFCTSETAFCSWLRADEAASNLKNKDFQNKKATFVLLNGSYTLAMKLSNCQIDIYGIVDHERKVQLQTPEPGLPILRTDGASRLRLRSLCIKGATLQRPEAPLLCLTDASCTSMSQILHASDLTGPVVQVTDSRTFVLLHDCRLTSHSASTQVVAPQVVMMSGVSGIIGAGTTATTSFKFAGELGHALPQPPAMWKPITNASSNLQPESQKAFLAAMRQLAQASAALETLQVFSKYLKGSSVSLCETNAELEAALCREGASQAVICLRKTGLAVSQPLCVKEAVLIGMASLTGSCCELSIDVQTDSSSINLDGESGLLEVRHQDTVTALTIIDVDVRITSTSTPEYLRGIQEFFQATET